VKGAGVFGAIAIAVVGIGGVSFMMWWNGELSEAKLEENICTEARKMYPLPARCKMTVHQSNDVSGVIAGATLEMDRMPSWTWFPGLEPVTCTGTYTENLQAALAVSKGDLVHLQRPVYSPAQLTLDYGRSAKNLDGWSRLDKEPANAAFDAMLHDPGYGSGAITYLSALRRMGKWHAVIEFFNAYWRDYEFVTYGWEDRMSGELDLIEQGPLEAKDRRVFAGLLAKFAKDRYWDAVLLGLEKKRAKRTAGSKK
jgi:hypothetical protein